MNVNEDAPEGEKEVTITLEGDDGETAGTISLPVSVGDQDQIPAPFSDPGKTAIITGIAVGALVTIGALVKMYLKEAASETLQTTNSNA